MYCNNCGTQNPAESSFCNKCGSKLAPQTGITQQPQAAAVTARKTNGLAIAALILGIAGFIPPLAICAIPAIILGAIALNQIKKEPGIEGKGMAMAGIICGSIALFLWICLLILWLVFAITSSTTSSNFWVSAINVSALI